MGTIAELKELRRTETPLLLFECELPSGTMERWSTHEVEYLGDVYEGRVLRHSVFEIRSAPEEGLDAAAKLTVLLSNADSRLSQIERAIGWKGSRLTVHFVFFDLRSGRAASEGRVVFRGVIGPPEELNEAVCRLAATNGLSLQRVWLPEVRVQRRCPWKFPRTVAERIEGAVGGDRGQYSPFFRCGYSPDVPGGAGNLNEGQPYASCDGSRLQCEQRGMFNRDERGNPTRRFGGIEFVPPSVVVRSHGERGRHVSEAVENEARYNDFVPLIYGTAWCAPLIVFARNDGNLTRTEALVGMGEIEGVLKVLVNGVEIPAAQAGADMTGTGWYNVVSLGARTGAFNLDFTDGAGEPLGDCYGSMAYLSVVVPNRISDGRSLPRIRALVAGLKLPQYTSDGTYAGKHFTNNPAWIILDILRRSGWTLEQIDLKSFAETAEYCGQLIEVRDLYGSVTEVPRFQCNLWLRRRMSAAELVRGIRIGSRLLLTYGRTGRLELRCENTLALQQPEKPEGSNSEAPLNGGWPAYEFGDGTGGSSGILRRENGEPAMRIWSRSMAETPNRFTVEFQDAFNEYQQDSVSLTDVDDVLRTGQEVCASLPALGIANFNQALRVVRFWLDKSVEGNTYVEFETSVKGFGLKPGDLITLTYLREGFERTPFRVLKVAPGVNYGRAVITAQIHRDEWYSDGVGEASGGGRRWSWIRGGAPRPLGGEEVDEEGRPTFLITERYQEAGDGGSEVVLTVRFLPPRAPENSRAEVPLLSLTPRITSEGGSLAGGRTLYYAISGTDANGLEGPLSFVVRAALPDGSDTNQVILSGLKFSPGTSAFHVYRGPSPSQLWRVAANQPIAASFTDGGLSYTATCPPDENYDHANFYWRFELQPEYAANVFGADRVGNTEARMATDAYAGMVVRITRGRGAGQERTVVANDATTLVVRPNWAVVPDHSSHFVVAEAAWHHAAVARSSPVEFTVPNRPGATVHVLGRSANARNEECAAEISPLTRWQLGSGEVPFDLEPPGKPTFGLALKGEGLIELAGISFASWANTRSIHAATLTLHFWNELDSPTPYTLAQDMNEESEYVELDAPGPGRAEGLIQVGQEIMQILGVENGGLRYRVRRGVHGSRVGSHAQHTDLYHLQRKVYVAPCVRGFFGSMASGNYAYPIYLPDVRIASAELFVTNDRGHSEATQVCLTDTEGGGLRTLSGGQITLQIEGFLAIQTAATPPFIVDATHSVRDVFAVAGEAAEGGSIEVVLRQDGEPYCTLRIPEGQTLSNVVSGFGRRPLRAGALLTVDVLEVGSTRPGRDLTVTVRL